jgi:hypothetical protein
MEVGAETVEPAQFLRSQIKKSPGSSLIVFLAKAGIHVSHGHWPEPVLGPRQRVSRPLMLVTRMW